jgi:hypothetical protein
MPLPNNPHIPEFYVYRFEVRGIPFYVGIGRSERASDRVRYVRYCMDREALGKPVKWATHCAVIRDLIRDGHEPYPAYVLRDVVRADALKAERVEIDRLVADGALLANIQHNPKRPKCAADVVTALRARLATAMLPVAMS